MDAQLTILTRGPICPGRDQRYSLGGLWDAREPVRYEHSLRRLECHDILAVAEEEPPLGSHLVTPRRGFTHHGIYVGRGSVVHYKSAVHGLRRGPLEEVSLARFALGRVVWIRVHAATQFDGAEVARRACARIGEDRYRLLTNNCEHFCEWCVHDRSRSYQVDSVLRLPRRLMRAYRRAAAAALHVLSRRPNSPSMNAWAR